MLSLSLSLERERERERERDTNYELWSSRSSITYLYLCRASSSHLNQTFLPSVTISAILWKDISRWSWNFCNWFSGTELLFCNVFFSFLIIDVDFYGGIKCEAIYHNMLTISTRMTWIMLPFLICNTLTGSPLMQIMKTISQHPVAAMLLGKSEWR